jgi:hypothetical protein
VIALASRPHSSIHFMPKKMGGAQRRQLHAVVRQPCSFLDKERLLPGSS